MDISLCINIDCPKGKTCYRLQAPGTEYQSQMNFKEICHAPTYDFYQEIAEIRSDKDV